MPSDLLCRPELRISHLNVRKQNIELRLEIHLKIEFNKYQLRREWKRTDCNVPEFDLETHVERLKIIWSNLLMHLKIDAGYYFSRINSRIQVKPSLMNRYKLRLVLRYLFLFYFYFALVLSLARSFAALCLFWWSIASHATAHDMSTNELVQFFQSDLQFSHSSAARWIVSG